MKLKIMSDAEVQDCNNPVMVFAPYFEYAGRGYYIFPGDGEIGEPEQELAVAITKAMRAKYPLAWEVSE